MSQVYSTEPVTSGRVIIETTHGPLEMQLWCRECPATTRFFLQLCLDGFYDDMVFHRIIPNFLVQTGALRHGKPSSSSGTPKDIQKYRSQAQAANALDRRSYELNSRIRFNHRGQVAMALGIDDDNDVEELQPQFFITLDEAPYLDGKHVVFATVSGPTVFNALRIGRTDIDETTNQPMAMAEAPRIQRIKIMENPIHTDIVPFPTCPWKMQQEQAAAKPKKKKRKGVKNVKLLSFGDEFEEEDEAGGGGMKSSHDLIQSKSLSKDIDKDVKKALETKTISQEDSKSNNKKEEELKKAKPPPPESTIDGKKMEQSSSSSSKHTFEKSETRGSAEKMTTIQETTTEQATKKTADATTTKTKPKLSLLEQRRLKYKKGTKDKEKRQTDTMQKLMAFQSKRSKVDKSVDTNGDRQDGLASRMFQKRASQEEGEDNDKKDGNGRSEAVTYHGQILEDEDEEEKNDWMKTRFKCRKHMDHDARLGGDGRNVDDYAVVDEKRGGGSSKRKGGDFDRDRSNRHKHKRKKST